MRYEKASKAIKLNHPKLGELVLIPEFPQVGEAELNADNVDSAIEEAIQFAGGKVEFVQYVNSAIESGAKNSVRTTMYQLGDDTTWNEEAQNKVLSVGRDYAPRVSQSKGPSQKSRATAFDELAKLAESSGEITITSEELAKLLAGAK